jgi:uncharacterized protein with gpF-like domain
MDISTKIEADDIDGYDWNWTDKYLEDFVADLVEAYMASYVAEFPDAPIERASPIPVDAVQREAAEWAMVHGADQIEKITQETKHRVRSLVKSGILSGHPVGRIANVIQGDFVFSALRATGIARTETAIALGQGVKGAAKAQGRNEKSWITQGDSLVSDDCLSNEGAGWIAIADPFPSGASTIPNHPNCRCNVRYRTKELHQDSVREDFRCPGCNRLLARNATKGIRIHCRHCKAERVA